MPDLTHDASAAGLATTYLNAGVTFTPTYLAVDEASGGSATQYSVGDYEAAFTVSAIVDHVAVVLADNPVLNVLSRGVSFVSLDPHIATVDASGRLTYVSNGTARIRIVTGYSSRVVRVPVSRETPASVTLFADWSAGSLAEHCTSAVLNVVSGKTLATNGPMYSNLASRLRNTNNILTLAGIDNTGIDAEKPNAFAIGTLYGIQAEHYPDASDVYVAADNTVHTRAVVNSVNIGPANASDSYASDFRVVKYDSALPGTISPIKLAPANLDDYLPGLGAISRQVLAISTDQEKKSLVNALFSTSFRMQFTGALNVDAGSFQETVIVGDSGSPSFLLINDELVAISGWTFEGYGSGPRYHDYLTEIQAAIDSMGGEDTVQTADLSGFPDYTAHNLITTSSTFGGFGLSTGMTLTGGQLAPDGTSTAYLYAAGASAETFGNTSKSVESFVESDTVYCQSVYAKANGSDRIQINLFDGFTPTNGGVMARIIVRLDTGATVLLFAVGGAGGGVESVGDGWYRVWCYGNVKPPGDPGGNLRAWIYPYTSPGVLPGHSVYLWHPQVNKGTVPAGYQST